MRVDSVILQFQTSLPATKLGSYPVPIGKGKAETWAHLRACLYVVDMFFIGL